MRLGQHIETGLTNLGNALERAKQNDIDWQRESYQLGLISDEDKIRVLMQELYRKAHVGKDTSDLRAVIEMISNRVEDERAYRHSLPNQLDAIARSVIGLLLLATLGSYAMAPICNSSQSRFCKDARRIPSVINRYFSDPKAMPGYVQQKNVYIDQN